MIIATTGADASVAAALGAVGDSTAAAWGEKAPDGKVELALQLFDEQGQSIGTGSLTVTSGPEGTTYSDLSIATQSVPEGGRFSIIWIENPAPDGSGDIMVQSYHVPPEGDGDPVLLIHGFASSVKTNWIEPGWVSFLTRAGFRVVAFDNRGHGQSEKLYDRALYSAPLMAEDARRLMDHLRLSRADVMGYSMGARITAFLALKHPERVRTAIPPRARTGHWRRILAALEEEGAGLASSAPDALNQAARLISRRGMIVLVSDLLMDTADVHQALKGLRAVGHDVTVLHIMDPAERGLAGSGEALFVDPETRLQVPASVTDVLNSAPIVTIFSGLSTSMSIVCGVSPLANSIAPFSR